MLLAKYSDKNDIPAGYEYLYIKTDEGYELLSSVQIKTTDDIERLQSSLSKERADHKATKLKYKSLDGLKPDEILTKLDKFAEFETKFAELESEGDVDQKVQTLYDAKMTTVVNPLNRKIKELTETNDTINKKYTDLQSQMNLKNVDDAIRAKCIDVNLRPEAVQDALLLGRTIFKSEDDSTGKNRVFVDKKGGSLEGLTPDAWLEEMKTTHPHWWPASVTSDATGSGFGKGTKNPFSKDDWNLTDQGKMVTKNRTLAEQMAGAAGTTVGGLQPLK